jgi:AP-1 complex subunit gamma-1
MGRVIRKVPDAVEGFQEAAAKLLSDRHHGVLLGGVSLMLEMCEVGREGTPPHP